jgi:hypothetical protein
MFERNPNLHIKLSRNLDVIEQTLAINLTYLLDKYELRKKIVPYVNDERSNLNIMIVSLKSIISCEILGLEESFQRNYFGHVHF